MKVTILSVMATYNPFSPDGVSNERNILSGLNVDSGINTYAANRMRGIILSSINGTSARDYSFKRSDQAVTWASMSSVRTENDQVQVDPYLMFQQLIFAYDNSRLKDFISARALHLSHISLLLFIYIKAAVKASTSRCTVDQIFN